MKTLLWFAAFIAAYVIASALVGLFFVGSPGVAASVGGAPADIAHAAGLVSVVDAVGSVSHLSIFSVDEDGNLKLTGVATIGSAANGVVIVPAQN